MLGMAIMEPSGWLSRLKRIVTINWLSAKGGRYAATTKRLTLLIYYEFIYMKIEKVELRRVEEKYKCKPCSTFPVRLSDIAKASVGPARLKAQLDKIDEMLRFNLRIGG